MLHCGCHNIPGSAFFALSGYHAGKMPSTLGQLGQLQTLNLSHNRMEDRHDVCVWIPEQTTCTILCLTKAFDVEEEHGHVARAGFSGRITEAILL